MYIETDYHHPTLKERGKPLKLKINEVAKLTGVTVRTLHYYDKIGLFTPSETTKSGYRIYDAAALETLQQILFFRELDFPLSDIKEIIANPHYDKTEVLTHHKELLLQKRRRMDGLIELVESIIKGDNNMNFQAFDDSEIEASKNKYAAEAKARWGQTAAYKQSDEKTRSYDKQQWKTLGEEGERLLKGFGEIRSLSPDCKEAQALVAQWQAYITASFYTCTEEILSSLGDMYTGDERFAENIDKNGEGTADFMAQAIKIYCGRTMEKR